MRKNHMVLLEEEDFNLARMLGLTNLSEYVRNSISYFISGSEHELTASEIRELTKQFALEQRVVIQQQQKITGRTEEELRQIEGARMKRMAVITQAVRIEVDRIGPDRFARYLEDTTGDYQSIQDDIIAAVSKASGHPADLSDLIAAFKVVRV